MSIFNSYVSLPEGSSLEMCIVGLLMGLLHIITKQLVTRETIVHQENRWEYVGNIVGS